MSIFECIVYKNVLFDCKRSHIPKFTDLKFCQIVCIVPEKFCSGSEPKTDREYSKILILQYGLQEIWHLCWWLFTQINKTTTLFSENRKNDRAIRKKWYLWFDLLDTRYMEDFQLILTRILLFSPGSGPEPNLFEKIVFRLDLPFIQYIDGTLLRLTGRLLYCPTHLYENEIILLREVDQFI